MLTLHIAYFVVNSRPIHKPFFFFKFIWRDRTGNLTQEERKYYLVLTAACKSDFPVAAVVKNPPANVGDIRDTDSILGLGRSPG